MAVERARTREHDAFGGNFVVTMTPLIDEDGDQVGTVLVARDVTDRRGSKPSARRLARRVWRSPRSWRRSDSSSPASRTRSTTRCRASSDTSSCFWWRRRRRARPRKRPAHLRRDLRLIYREADRAAKIVQNLLTFSGSQRKIRRTAAYRTRASRERWPAAGAALARAASTSSAISRTTSATVIGDPMLLQQALLNVIINAEHADRRDRPRRGTIVISTMTPRRPGRHHRSRLGQRHRRRCAAADLRSLLHDQGRRSGHRARPRHHLRHRAGTRRRHSRRRMSTAEAARLHDRSAGSRVLSRHALAGLKSGKVRVPHMAEEGFLTTEEVLEYLQVNLRTVYRLIKAGKIPAVRVGRQWRFRKRDIDAWLESQRPRPGRRGRDVGAPRPAGWPAAAHSRRRRRSGDSRSAVEDAGARRVRRRSCARRPHGARASPHHSLRSADH